MSKYRISSGPYFPVFSRNTGKHGPEKTPYLDIFCAVRTNQLEIPTKETLADPLLVQRRIDLVYPLPPLLFMKICFKQTSRIGLKLLLRLMENSTNYWVTTVCLCLKIYQTNLLIQYISQAVVLLKSKMIRAKWSQRSAQ